MGLYLWNFKKEQGIYMNVRNIRGKLSDTKDFATTMWRIGRAVGAIFIGICLILTMNKLDDQYKSLKEKADAEVISVDSHFIELEYEYEGITYTSKTIVKNEREFDVGDEVRVKFSDDEPSVAVLAGSDQYNTYSVLAKVMMVVGLVFILIGVINFIPNLKYLLGRIKDLSEPDNNHDEDYEES